MTKYLLELFIENDRIFLGFELLFTMRAKIEKIPPVAEEVSMS